MVVRILIVLLGVIGLAVVGLASVVGMNFGLVPSPSRTLTFPEQNCSCRIPCLWIIRDQHSVLLRAHNLFGGTFSLSAKKYDAQFDVTSPSFADSIRQNMEGVGFKMTEQDTKSFQGRPAFSYSTQKSIGGRVVYERATTFAVGKVHYMMILTKVSEEPSQDAQLVAAENSFTLLNPNTN